MSETFRPIPGFPTYEISESGIVRSVPRISVRSNGISANLRSRVLHPWRDPKTGYSRVCLSVDGVDTLERVHRLVALTFIRVGLPAEVVRHLNGDSTNNHFTNLAWGTESENQFDKVRHGRHHNQIKTGCPRGHLLRAPNLRESVARHGWRGCLSCKRAQDHARTHPGTDIDAFADEFYRTRMEVAA